MTDNFASNPFRPLLPLPLPRTPTSTATAPNAQASGLVPKRSAVKAACEACRRRKAKCDAERPSCSPCIDGGRECEYRTAPSESRTAAVHREHSELKRKLNDLQNSQNILDRVFQAIQSRPEAEAAAIFKRIREGADCESVMRHISTGDILLQLHVTPETKYRYVFPYRTQIPISLQSPHNPYLHSLVYETTFVASDRQSSPSFADEKYRAQYLKPLHAARIVDPRLDTVKPSIWTNVCSDDDLMRAILRAYLLSEYHRFTIFHKDHFLDDMVRESNRFCSPLLVNAVLALACHYYHDLPDRSEFWNPRSLAYQFGAEAKRLWELEQTTTKSSLTALQAITLIGFRFSICGMDKIGLTYLLQAIAMAHDLKLFEQSTNMKSSRMRNSRDFTAWCLFNIQSYCYTCFLAPLIKEPLKITLPDPKQNPAWYGDFWIKYPLNQTLYPMDYGYNFKAKSEFCLILNRIAVKFFDNEGGFVTQPPHKKIVADFVSDLAEWYFSLPDPLTPKKIVFPSQIILHLQYYSALAKLWELVVTDADPIPEFPAPGTPHAVLAHSKMCIETLMRLYYLRHGFETADVLLTHYLSALSTRCVNALKTLTLSSTTSSLTAADDARATLILSAKGLRDQGRSYPLSETLYHVVEKRMSSEDVELMEKFVQVRKEDSEARKLRANHLQSQLPMNVVNITEDAEINRLSNLIKQYADSPTISQAFSAKRKQ